MPTKIEEITEKVIFVKNKDPKIKRTVKIIEYVDGYLLHFGLLRVDSLGERFDEIADSKIYKNKKTALKKAEFWVTMYG